MRNSKMVWSVGTEFVDGRGYYGRQVFFGGRYKYTLYFDFDMMEYHREVC